jgi:hypothetical protein
MTSHLAASMSQPGVDTSLLGASTLHGGAIAEVRRKALFNWQYSVDGGKTFVSAPSTPLASTEIQGLPTMTTVMFRVSVLVSRTPGEWSQAVALFVK